jgi:DNA-binding beta-propeller fold protein YncE
MGRIIKLTDVTLSSTELLALKRLLNDDIEFVAGAGTTGADNGVGAAAKFNTPAGLCVDPSGATLYIADSGTNLIRKIDLTTATVTTLAGSGAAGGADATGTSATFKTPIGICMDSAGANLYCVDYGGHTVRKIVAATGVVTTIAGTYNSSGTTDADGAAARLKNPFGIAIDSSDTYL